MKILRIVFCVAACISAAAAVVIGMIFGMWWFIGLAVATAIFAAGMIFCKNRSDPPRPQAPDFMNSDEKNAELIEKRAEWDRNHPEG